MSGAAAGSSRTTRRDNEDVVKRAPEAVVPLKVTRPMPRRYLGKVAARNVPG